MKILVMQGAACQGSAPGAACQARADRYKSSGKIIDKSGNLS
jgi:hypothetical protein